MNNEGNKRIHALVDGGCWHEFIVKDFFSAFCKSCGVQYFEGVYDAGPDYGSETLPDNLRIAMVTAAVERWGSARVATAFVMSDADCPWFPLLPAPAIAAAVDTLLIQQEAAKDG